MEKFQIWSRIALFLSLQFFIYNSVEAGWFPRHHPFADQYSSSLEKHFGLSLGDFRKLSQEIYLAHPSLIRKWGWVNKDASATYNGVLRTIEVFPDLTVGYDFGRRLVSFDEIECAGQRGA